MYSFTGFDTTSVDILKKTYLDYDAFCELVESIVEDYLGIT